MRYKRNDRFNADVIRNRIIITLKNRSRMGSLPKKLLVFCLLLAFILAANNSSMNGTANMTFAPPPPINTTVAVMLNSSQVDGRFIGSKRI
jgi:hypothetical protein